TCATCCNRQNSNVPRSPTGTNSSPGPLELFLPLLRIILQLTPEVCDVYISSVVRAFHPLLSASDLCAGDVSDRVAIPSSFPLPRNRCARRSGDRESSHPSARATAVGALPRMTAGFQDCCTMKQ